MHTHSQARCCLSFPSSTTFEWHFQIGSKKQSERQRLFLLTTYFTSALSCCLVTKKDKKKTLRSPWKLWFQCHISVVEASRSQISGSSCGKMADKGTAVPPVLTSSSTPLTARSSPSCRWRWRDREVGWWAVENQGEHNKGEKITEHQSGTPAFKTSHCTSDTTQRHELQRALRTHTHRLH